MDQIDINRHAISPAAITAQAAVLLGALLAIVAVLGALPLVAIKILETMLVT